MASWIRLAGVKFAELGTRLGTLAATQDAPQLRRIPHPPDRLHRHRTLPTQRELPAVRRSGQLPTRQAVVRRLSGRAPQGDEPPAIIFELAFRRAGDLEVAAPAFEGAGLLTNRVERTGGHYSSVLRGSPTTLGASRPVSACAGSELSLGEIQSGARRSSLRRGAHHAHSPAGGAPNSADRRARAPLSRRPRSLVRLTPFPGVAERLEASPQP
jgi:hypothetical protein